MDEPRPTLNGLPVEIDRLDLERIKWKLASKDSQRWSTDHLALLDKEYRRFLALKLWNPEASLVPTEFVDEVWHVHILDTKAYAEDTARIFGRFIHHYPYFGMHGPDDHASLEAAFSETTRLYVEAFGEPMPVPVEARCAGHACHAPSSCGCRSPGACK